MYKTVLAIVVALLIATQSLSSTSAQDEVQRVYGAGVHAYFNGQFEKAVTYLNKSIDAGSTDARAYYFRGLAHHQLGKTKLRDKDFVAGAELEKKYAEQQRRINRSLQRVQGDIRIALENSRRGIVNPTKTITIDKTRVNVTAPVSPLLPNSGIGDKKGGDSPRPNLPDSSKVNDPNLPFSGTKSTPKSTPKSEPKMKPADLPKTQPKKDNDLFGQPEPGDKVKAPPHPIVPPSVSGARKTTPPKTNSKRPPVDSAKPVDTPKMEPKKVEPPKLKPADKTEIPKTDSPKTDDDLFGDNKVKDKPVEKPVDAPKPEPKKTEPAKSQPPAKMEPKNNTETPKSADDLFGDEKGKEKTPPKGKTPPQPAPKKEPAEDDIFGDKPSKPADKKAEPKKMEPKKQSADDIFGDAPAKKKEEKKADAPKKKDASKKQDADDIFGDTKPGKSSDAKKKSTDKKGAPQKDAPKKKDADDIFGDG